ncbi:unnamed protein product, partial [Medioppia subpectinata]
MGGIFNRSAEVDFPQTGHLNLQIRGSMPSVPSMSKVLVDDFLEEFTRVSAGVIRSHATHSFRFGETSLSIPIVIDQTITYEECEFAPIDDKLSTLQLAIARNFIVYDKEEQIVRYASTSKTSFLSADDPCRTGSTQCGTHSSCVVEGLSFKCICDRGYQTDFITDAQNELRVSNCIDINECSSSRQHACHSFADCINIEGSYACRCKAGYTGDGYQCQKEQRCESLITCGPNAQCIHLEQRNPECKCKHGYAGDGQVCRRSDRIESETEDCRTYNLCDVNAECLANPSTQRHQCFCRAG